MGNWQSYPTDEEATTVLTLVRNTLPVIIVVASRVAKEQLFNGPSKNARIIYYDHVGKVHLAATTLLQVLEEIDAKATPQNNAQILGLARSIEGIFRPSQAETAAHGTLAKYPILEGISRLSRNGPFRVNDLVDSQAINCYEPWKAIHVASESVIDDLTHNGVEVNEMDAIKPLKLFTADAPQTCIETPRVTFLGTATPDDDATISDSNPLCIHEAFERLEGDSSQCIDMEIRDNGLHFSDTFLVKRDLRWVDTLRSEKTLKYLLDDSPKERWAQAEVSRIVLGLMLAKNLHYFYGSTWIETGWSRDKIFFLEEGAQVPLRPFFGTSTPQIKPDNPAVTAFWHRYPEILELGAILLEMKIGEPLERFLDLKYTLRDIDDYFKKATNVFDRQKDHIFSVAYKNAIETCLRPNFKLSPGNGSSYDVRSMLFEHVVKPLQKEVMGRFPENFKPDQFDERAANYDLFGSELSRMLLFPPSQTTREIQAGRYESYANEGIDTGQQSFEDPSQGIISQETLKQTKTSRWKCRFKRLVEKHVDSHGPRLTVAILDTGINHHHIDLVEETRIKESLSFLGDGKNSVEDLDGHGTHVAGLLLELSSNVDVIISRVARTDHPESPTQVINALKHAIKRRVDIIAMSFGYLNPIKEIQVEIRAALDANIMIFAAASNDGINSPRAYPASEPGVFCIHSTTSEGQLSRFNPNVEGEINFAVVGEHLKSPWLGHEGYQYMSGTSVANPVAIAFAALMYGFVCKEMSKEQPMFHHQIRSHEGLQRVFKLMSCKKENYDVINPLSFFQAPLQAIKGRIIGILYR
ncbi:pfs domain-containing protein [Apiospora saccharicola]|uniref:Pfs domain-containing protein n=1 Tax=Apiospora saccharicola TaxID=335842 RepID=A0ABR1VQH8_9PEZI